MREIYKQYAIETPEDLVRFLRIAGQHYCIFRGQSAAYETISPKIVRGIKSDLRPHLVQFERDLVHYYQQHAQHHLAAPPSLTNYFEWISIIQHYGGPTRLLDFTQSLFVAAYFAVTNQDDKDGLIFCFSGFRFGEVSLFENRNRGKLAGIAGPVEIPQSHHVEARARGQQIVPLDIPQIFKRSVGREMFNEMVFKSMFEGDLRTPGLVFAKPFLLNKRMIAQNALFAIPFSLEHTLEDNLAEMYPDEKLVTATATPQAIATLDISKERLPAIVLRIPAKLRSEMQGLLGQMGVTTEALFPDLEGLSRAMNDRIPKFLYE